MNRICVTIAARDTIKLDNQINKAFQMGADYVEIRFDFVKLVDIDKAIEVAKKVKKRAVFTLRSPSEEGRFEGDLSDRLNSLKKMAAVNPMLLDVELDTIKSCNNNEKINLMDYFKKQQVRILVSWHNFKNTPSNKKLRAVLEEMRTYSNYIKMVTTANGIEDSIRILDLYKNAPGLVLIAFAMGESGILSRIFSTLLKRTPTAPFTYAALEKPIAPGQMTLEQMKRLYNRIDVSPCSN
jgi:3-dehydroquinate dehydratase-1